MNHGYTAYKKRGCRCEVCSAENIRRNKRYRLITGAGRDGRPARPMTVDGARVRAHLDALYASGWTSRSIANETGLTINRVTELRRGYKSSRVTLAVAGRLFALEPLTPVTVDPVVVDRLVAGADWRAIGATRQERIAAAPRMPSVSEAERRLGLRAGRDFVRGAA